MDNNKVPETKQRQTDFTDLLRSYMDRWPLFLVSVIAFVIIGAVYCYMRTTRFEVQANVLITDDDKEADLMRAAGLSDLFSANASADAELEIIKSFTLYRNVVQQLGLNTRYVIRHNILKRQIVYDDTPLRLILPDQLPDTLIGNLHFKVRIDKKGLTSVKVYNLKKKKVYQKNDLTLPATLATPYGDFRLETTPDFKSGKALAMSIWAFSYDAAAENLQKEVRCFTPSKKADVITVAYLASDVAQGKKIVNEIVDEYNDRGIEQSRKKARKIAEFIDERLASLSTELASTELDAEQFKKKNNLTNLSADAEYMMTKRGQVEVKLFEAESSLASLELTRQMLANPDERDAMLPIPPAVASAGNIIEDYNKMILKRMQLEKTAKPTNTSLIILNDRIEALRKNIFTTLDKAIETAKLQLKELKTTNSAGQAKLSQVPRQEREYLDIARQQEIQQSLYLFMLREREQTNMRIANALPKGQIIDRAYSKIKPSGLGNAVMIILFALIGVIAVPVVLYFRDLLRNHVNTADELKKLTSFPVIGQIPAEKDNKEQVDEDFVGLATSLKHNAHQQVNRVIAVTAAAKGQGASFTAANLAAAYASMGHSVVLLELNFRDPQLAATQGAKAAAGPAQYLAGLADKLLPTAAKSTSGYDVIPAETAVRNPALLLAKERMNDLINELTARYDYVIIDAASIDFASDVISIAAHTNSLLIVVRAGVTTLAQIRRINAFVRDNALDNAELVVDGTKPPYKIFGITI
ncbi:MAG: AAA family ATPase [Muribaculum sp.]|nr:AAA family ATPase [Muribaculaceae bacterium]MCM1080493.1 AAA family ATPase [Muribaculum sp.]